MLQNWYQINVSTFINFWGHQMAYRLQKATFETEENQWKIKTELMGFFKSKEKWEPAYWISRIFSTTMFLQLITTI